MYSRRNSKDFVWYLYYFSNVENDKVVLTIKCPPLLAFEFGDEVWFRDLIRNSDSMNISGNNGVNVLLKFTIGDMVKKMAIK